MQFEVIEAGNPGELVKKLNAWKKAHGDYTVNLEFHYAIDGDEAGATYSVLIITR